MAVTHEATVRNDIAQLVLDAIDVDVGAGNLVMYLAGGVTEVATLVLADPAAPAPSGGVITFDTTPAIEDTNATGNASPVAEFAIQANLGGDVIFGSLGTSGQDINLSSLTIANGDTVQVTSLTYTAAV